MTATVEYNENSKRTIPASALKGCPLCGGAVEGHEHTFHGMSHQMEISCRTCGLHVFTSDADPDRMVERAVAKWNNRCE